MARNSLALSITHSMKEYERGPRVDGYEMWLGTYMKPRDVFIAGDHEPARTFDAFGNI